MPTCATGPRTAAGKAASARNATRHGLLSAAILGPHESAADWQNFRAGAVQSLAPVGRLETAVAERVAHLYWRLARLARYEAAALEAALAAPDEPAPAPAEPEPSDAPPDGADQTAADDEQRKLDAFFREYEADFLADMPPKSGRVLPGAPTIALIMRYEAHLSRELTRTLHQYERFQSIRAALSLPNAGGVPPRSASACRCADSASTGSRALGFPGTPAHSHPDVPARPANMKNCQTNSAAPAPAPQRPRHGRRSRSSHGRSAVPAPAMPRTAPSAPVAAPPAPPKPGHRRHTKRMP